MKRDLQVKLVKPAKTDKEGEAVDKQIDMGVLAQDIATAVISVMGTYFALSTARGILTHIVVTKVQPPIFVEAVKDSE